MQKGHRVIERERDRWKEEININLLPSLWGIHSLTVCLEISAVETVAASL